MQVASFRCAPRIAACPGSPRHMVSLVSAKCRGAAVEMHEAAEKSENDAAARQGVFMSFAKRSLMSNSAESMR